MQTINKFFGKPRIDKAPSAEPTTSSAVDDTNETLELVVKREAHVERLVAKEVDAARAAVANNNQKAALECVKRKKMYEKELDRLSVQKLNLMQQEQMLHSLKFNSIVLHTQEKGAAA